MGDLHFPQRRGFRHWMGKVLTWRAALALFGVMYAYVAQDAAYHGRDRITPTGYVALLTLGLGVALICIVVAYGAAVWRFLRQRHRRSGE